MRARQSRTCLRLVGQLIVVPEVLQVASRRSGRTEDTAAGTRSGDASRSASSSAKAWRFRRLGKANVNHVARAGVRGTNTASPSRCPTPLSGRAPDG